MSEFTLLLQRAQTGDTAASAQLLPLVYDELRRLAAHQLAGERAAFTFQPTALVHEAWLRLGGDAPPVWQNRRHFFGAAAEAMRRILIDAARQRQAVRHGGDLQRVGFSAAGDLPAPAADERLLAVSEALDRLAAAAPEKAELVKLRYFVGLTLEEAAATLDISPATAKRWWNFARAWLFDEVAAPAPPPARPPA